MVLFNDTRSDANKIKLVVPSQLPEKVQVDGREVNIVRQLLTARLILMEHESFLVA
jgi:hypothetical protein